jgi:hypothetical protein
MSKSGGERRKIQPFDRQRRVFLTKFWGFGSHSTKTERFRIFLSNGNCKNSKSRAEHSAQTYKKTRCYRLLNNKPFFHLTILSYKIFNFEQSIVHILLTILTTGLDKGRA